MEARGLQGLTLVLHDLSGPIGLGLAARSRDLVRRLVLANTTSFAPRRKRAFSPWHRAFASRLG